MQNQLQVLPTPTPPPEPETCYDKQKLTNKQIEIIKWAATIQKLLKLLDGRDKMMKTIQYFIKILMHYKWAQAKHWSTITSQFSITRKVLRLGNAIGPVREISPWKDSPKTTFFLLNEIVNDISDDVFCFYKLGLVNKKIGTRAEIISAYCWFIGILNDVKENVTLLRKQQRELCKKDEAIVTDVSQGEIQQKLQKIFITEISIVKLFMDGIFCACDIWNPSYSSSAQAWSGFFSGLLAAYKLWLKNY
ncbi:hypothetical protein G6F57_012147 [Rhizopus arrhizus]|uniref:Peroxisomal biogenesis factor 11 n=1 Tax=Rhizopus oryzae TaxID=64495 RepID=A0A9P6X0X8_RHIOR|nr:hypothetical protein G6F23_006894 [Rhizopus arrhizus]KAG1405086.1 hypothetical protein G6F58_010078 [Rhizopus delemar]KAG0755570.1 hypothetical protein G6F24_011743 [Rhizopus arrhizus]KAG0774698.1 hypothetical protein G6F22_013859 [Rhizopus arrhizus]KAG0783232.1 hypothetical protein G6F21_010654 [Rhizopus arrhizus]